MTKVGKKQDDEKGMHDGHRKRLIDTVYNVGLDQVSNIQALEFILFYVFPRGDVNPLSHRLLDRFHDVPTVLEASVEDLMQVKGMGETAAKKLRALLDVFFFYSQEKLTGKDTLKTIGDFYDYIEQMLRYRPIEELYLFGVNSMGEVTKGRRFNRGSFNMVAINIVDFSLYTSTHKVNAFIIVHNHPGGSAKASLQDDESFGRLKNIVESCGGKLVDSIIVGQDGIYSMDKGCMQRVFSQGIEYLSKIQLTSSLKTTQ